MRAYILLKVAPKDTPHLMNDLQHVPRINEASVIHGPYDCIALVEAKSLDELHETVNQIRTLDGVIDTMTCMVMHYWERSSGYARGVGLGS